MGLLKKTIEFNFSSGIDTKTDPNQVAIGKFINLENIVFDNVGLLMKRNGFGSLTTLSASFLSSITTYMGSLVALGNTLNIYSPDQNLWITKGQINQVSLNTITLYRSATSQSAVDSAVSAAGLSCTVWVDSDGNSKYQVNDSSNGQVLLSAVNLPTVANAPRVFALTRSFLITFLTTVSATPHLQYISVPYTSLSSPTSATDISAQVKTNATGYDGAVYNGTLYIAWNGSDGGGAIRQCSINSALTQSTTHVISGQTADLMSVVINPTNTNIWMTFWNSSANNALTAILDLNGNVVLTSTTVLSSTVISQITGVINGGILNLFYQVTNTYPSSVRSDYVQTKTVTITGSGSSATTVLRSVGLASKAFLVNSIPYVMMTYGGSFQPTYFISDVSGNIQAKLAYANGGGYVSGQVLPNVSTNLSGNIFIPYLYKDLLLSVSKLNTVDQVQAGAQIVNSNVYSQSGINGASFNFSTGALTNEISGSLHLTGGFLSSYDGVRPVENNFHVWPEDITGSITGSGGGLQPQQYWYQVTYEWTDGQGFIIRSSPSVPLKVDSTSTTTTNFTFTSVFSSGANSITASSVTGLFVGQYLTDSTTGTNIQANTYITSIVGSVVGLSLPTAGNSASSPGDTLSTNNVITNTLTIPTLRLTAKTGVSLVRIVVYRWSTANQEYYQTSSITSPLLNNPAADTVTFTDRNNDNSIIGNPLIYTTGGVVEDISPPSTQIMTLWQDRLFLVDAEDQNLIWFSKQAIENTPLEMSDLLTIYVAPSIGATGPTGPITALFPMDSNLIIFKENIPFYITGTGPDNLGNNNLFTDPQAIAASVGCDNQSSLVLIPQGLMFESQNGIWILERNLQTNYIGAAVEDFTMAGNVLSAVSVPGTNQVRFTLDSGVTLMYDHYKGEWSTFTGIPSISSCIYNEFHTILNQYGKLFQETPGIYLDGTNPVLVSFTSAWIKSEVMIQGWQRAYWFVLLGNYISPHNLTIGVAYDFNPSIYQQAAIAPDNYSPAWGGDTKWGGSPDLTWGGNGPIEQWQVNFEKQSCQSFQLTLTEQFDPTKGQAAGAGLTISGLNLVVGTKKAYPRNISTTHRTG